MTFRAKTVILLLKDVRRDIMKRVISFILIFLLTAGLYSCGGAVGEAGKETTAANAEREFERRKFGVVWEDYIFIRRADSVIMKYNIKSGETTFLCPDPFCTHTDKGCQFFSVSFVYIGNTVYYTKQDEISGKGTMYSFDADTAETKTVYSQNGVLNCVYAYEQRILLYAAESYERTSGRYYFWYDTANGKTEELRDSVINQNYIIHSIENDRIIWHPVRSDEYYSTDLSGGDFKEYTFGNYYGNRYRGALDTDGDGVQHYNMYVTLKGESEERLLIADLGLPLFAEDKIIYTKTVPKEERKIAFVDEFGNEFTDDYGGDVYIMDPDGKNSRLLFHTDESIAEMIPEGNVLISGDYFAITSEYYIETQGMINRYIIANIKTGEFAVTQ